MQLFVFSEFSSYNKLVRVLADVKRIALNCLMKVRNNRIQDENVSAKEFNEAEMLILKYKQQYFHSRKEDFNDLFNSLNLFIDKVGLIKVKGTLQNSTLEFSILLQKDSYTTHLLIWKCHKQRYHYGFKTHS